MITGVNRIRPQPWQPKEYAVDNLPAYSEWGPRECGLSHILFNNGHPFSTLINAEIVVPHLVDPNGVVFVDVIPVTQEDQQVVQEVSRWYSTPAAPRKCCLIKSKMNYK